MIMVVEENCNKRIENIYQSGCRSEYRGKIKEKGVRQDLGKDTVRFEPSRAEPSQVKSSIR